MSTEREEIYKTAGWTSPSNIAIVKYWGKQGNQLPANASLSMTLKNSITTTVVTLLKSKKPSKVKFYFGGVPVPGFEPKIEAFLKKVVRFFPFLEEYTIKIESWNTFPHSAGIASSASSMSALALCLCDISGNFENNVTIKADFLKKASEIARIGSGSASRSVYGGFSIWGKTSLLENSSDEFALPLDFIIHPAFSEIQDTILIVNSAKKKISSSSGHQLMNHHPYAIQRFANAEKNLSIVLNALRTGNINDFIRVTENEALGLHALMMSSDPGFMLIEPGTVAIINKILNFREKTGLFLCFTLDAGPNVHLLYPKSEKTAVSDFINKELLVHCENGRVLWDETGNGPEKSVLSSIFSSEKRRDMQ